MWIVIFFQLESSFTVGNVAELTLITGQKLNKKKSKNNSLPYHLFFYLLKHFRSFINQSLVITYEFRFDTNEYRFWYIHIQVYFIQFRGVFGNQLNIND